MDRSPFRNVVKLLALPIAIALCGVGGFRASPGSQLGTFALRGGTPAVISELSVVRKPRITLLKIVQWRKNDAMPITAYDIDQTKVMHVIVVRDDFREFAHLHPFKNGAAFTVPVALDAGHRYYAYADSRPSGYPQQVFRFTLQGQAPPSHQDTVIAPSDARAFAGPYSVVLTNTRLHAGMRNIGLIIYRDGHPATDLTEYLGARAHAVLLNTASLQYLHVHAMPPMSMEASMMMGHEAATLAPGTHVPPSMMFHANLPAGAYKLWVQFRGARQVWTAPFTLLVR